MTKRWPAQARFEMACPSDNQDRDGATLNYFKPLPSYTIKDQKKMYRESGLSAKKDGWYRIPGGGSYQLASDSVLHRHYGVPLSVLRADLANTPNKVGPANQDDLSHACLPTPVT